MRELRPVILGVFLFILLNTLATLVSGQSGASGEITAAEGSTSSVSISANAASPQGLERVSVVFVPNGPPLALCDDSDPEIPDCPPNSGEWTVTDIDPLLYGVTGIGPVTLGLWALEDGSEIATRLDDFEFMIFGASEARWTSVGSLVSARSQHSIVQLPSGEVLVSGGWNGESFLATTEVFDPRTGIWRETGELHTPRRGHTATLLATGKVLVVGGEGDASNLPTEIYDPATGIWTSSEDPEPPRVQHTATLLATGEVLIVGGLGGGYLAEADLYDDLGNRSAARSLQTARAYHTATLLPSGGVLVTGGSEAGVLASTELYDRDANIWVQVGDLVISRERHSATLLPDSRVLVVGGFSGAALASAELFDIETLNWREVTPQLNSRGSHAANLLANGKVLVAGGVRADALLSAEIFNPTFETWEATAALQTPRYGFASALLPSGEVLVVGGMGENGGFVSSTEIYDPALEWWVEGELMAGARASHTATLLPDGQVLVAGGASNVSLTSSELYDPLFGVWDSASPLNHPRDHFTATLLPSGMVLAAGGRNSGVIASSELYDPAGGSWQLTGFLVDARHHHSATLLASGQVLVAGGSGIGGVTLSSAEIFDGSWSQVGDLNHERHSHTATLLPSGKVLVVGGQKNLSAIYLRTAELYDPQSGEWSETGSMTFARSLHTATLLPSGKVLVVGGFDNSSLTSTELYDTSTETWTVTGSLELPRARHTATLLPSGKVMIAGGYDNGSRSSAEVYDPAKGRLVSIFPMSVAREQHAATRLPSGEVLVTGGYGAELGIGGDPLATTDLLVPPFPEERRPVLSAAPLLIEYGVPFTLTGDRLRGDSEAGGGTARSAAVDAPLVQIQSIEGSRLVWLTPSTPPSFLDASPEIRIDLLAPALGPGWHQLTVWSSGVPSVSKLIEVGCSLEITRQPSDQVGAIGTRVEFEVEAQGGRTFQWRRDGIEVPEANGSTYTTPPITAADSGTVYDVVVDSGCVAEASEGATLIVEDHNPPEVSVISPNGGEYWLLSSLGDPVRQEFITWSMSDNIRICRVEVSLLASDDGGTNYSLVPPSGGLPVVFGDGGTCLHPGVDTTNVVYEVPTSPPSGTAGSLYKIELQVTDHAGLVAFARSANPFYIRQSSESVRTLILTNLGRMEREMEITAQQVADLQVQLQQLAAHERVLGHVVDLDGVSDLTDLYDAWDANRADADRANRVLFGCHPPFSGDCTQEKQGIHDQIRALRTVFPGLEYVLLVGDDRIIPMARIRDRTALFSEVNYTDPVTGSLTATGTTVGQALAADRYLSDDPLMVLDVVHPDELNSSLFIPDLKAGRLVEEPAEIITAIAVFLSQDGLLDLSLLDAAEGHKVLVTGYDFLLDSAGRIRAQWKNALGLSPPYDDDSLAPVDGQLLSPDWGEPSVSRRRVALRSHLAGNGGERYGIVNFNGHATHYEEGVPGVDRFDIEGLPAIDVYGSSPEGCGTGLGPLDLIGSVVYAVGCHGGLPVAGSCATDAESSLDLPQTMLARGVQAYVANSGYGWGLLYGIGYSERLMEIFTEEITRRDLVVFGDLVQRAKQRYFLEAPLFDPYDEKTLMQWTLFGFPMYAVRTSVITGGEQNMAAFPAATPKAADLPPVERDGVVRIRRKLSKLGDELPAFVTRLELSADLTAPDVYLKYDATGERLPDEPGCPAGSEGCYYTLNGLVERSSGAADLPIQPYFIYDSRFSGTSQHGVLWRGGTYEEEVDWIPVFGEPVSNGGDGSEPGTLPRHVVVGPLGTRLVGGEDPDDCRPTDLEFNGLVVTTGEAVSEPGDDLSYSIERRYREIDLEIFYFHNTLDGSGNCDRSGPELDEGPFDGEYHRLDGSLLEWAVPASDVAGVWRVVVVTNDGSVDSQGFGAWVPLELEDDGTGIWRGSLPAGGLARLTYVVQAIDRRGNLSWVDYETVSTSGILHRLPRPIDVEIVAGSADLVVELSDAPDPVATGSPLVYTAVARNLGPTSASSVALTIDLPDEVEYVFSGGEGWNCGESEGAINCSRQQLELGEAPAVTILVTVLADNGVLTATAEISAFESDPDPVNNSSSATTTLSGTSMADLFVVKEDEGGPAVPGGLLSYSITVTNLGPAPVFDATVTDFFPIELQGVEWACVASPGSSCSTTTISGDINDLVDLLSGGTLLYTAVGLVEEDAVGTIENTATVSLPADMIDPNLDNNISTVSTGVSLPSSLIFRDGFESGDLSAWGGSQVRIEVRDQAPLDGRLYLARFNLGPGVTGPGRKPWAVIEVVDKTSQLQVLVLGLVWQEGRYRLIAQLDQDDARPLDSGFLDLDGLPRHLEIRWRRGPGQTVFLELRIDGRSVWTIEPNRSWWVQRLLAPPPS